MGWLLKVILFGLVFYYIFKTVGSLVLRIVGGKRPPQQDRQSQQYSKRREGEINIDYNPGKGQKRKSSIPPKEGDYIDFEEVK